MFSFVRRGHRGNNDSHYYYVQFMFTTKLHSLSITYMPGSIINYLFVCLFRAAPATYQGSQARGSNQSYSCWPMPQPQQRGIWTASATYTTTHGNAGSLTPWARPGIEPTTSWFLIGFISTTPQGELPNKLFKCSSSFNPLRSVFFFFNWSIVDLWCISFRWNSKVIQSDIFLCFQVLFIGYYEIVDIVSCATQ